MTIDPTASAGASSAPATSRRCSPGTWRCCPTRPAGRRRLPEPGQGGGVRRGVRLRRVVRVATPSWPPTRTSTSSMSPRCTTTISARRELCLEAGKSVLVEKPLTITAAEAERAGRPRAANRDLFLMEAVWMRTNPLIRKAAERSPRASSARSATSRPRFGFAFDGDGLASAARPCPGRWRDPGPGRLPGARASTCSWASRTRCSASAAMPAPGSTATLPPLLTYPATESTAGSDRAACLHARGRPAHQARGLLRRGADHDRQLHPARRRSRCPGGARDSEPEVVITQWPGGGYTFQAQEVMRCLRAGASWSRRWCLGRTRWQHARRCRNGGPALAQGES